MRTRDDAGVSWIEDEIPGVRVIFSTRLGGGSTGPYASLNLGVATGDEAAAVAANRERLFESVEVDPAMVVSAKQVHGTTLARWPGGPASGTDMRPEADGHVVADDLAVPLVLVADCLPVALSGPGGAALLHCGWRGIAAGLPALGVEAVGATAASIGPGIGVCCFQAGMDVVSRFEGLGDDVVRGDHVDLAAATERLLRDAGVQEVHQAGLCTSCESGRFFSHRRDRGTTGRQGALLIPCPS